MTTKKRFKKRFKWLLSGKYGSRGPYYWESDTIRLDLCGFHKSFQPKVSATYMSRHSGPNTAYARFVVYFSRSKFSFALSKHFEGPNAHIKARSWCNWLLNNCPNYSTNWRDP
jgi:hypothetical protein